MGRDEFKADYMHSMRFVATSVHRKDYNFSNALLKGSNNIMHVRVIFMTTLNHLFMGGWGGTTKILKSEIVTKLKM